MVRNCRVKLNYKTIAMFAMLMLLIQNIAKIQRNVPTFSFFPSSISAVSTSRHSNDASSWKRVYAEFQNDIGIARDNFVKTLGTLKAPEFDALAAVANTSRIVLNGGLTDYVLQLPKGSRSLTKYTTVVTSQARQPSTVLLKHYYRAYATAPVCGWLLGIAVWKEYFSCPSEKLNAAQLAPVSITDGGLAREDVRSLMPFADYNPNQFFSHLTLVAYARVNENGCVLSSDLVIAQQGCFAKVRDACQFTTEQQQIPELNEVFVITQYWGDGYFHMNVENFPKIAPYVEFLLQHPDIYIHVALPPQSNVRAEEHIYKTMQLLGLDPDRVVAGVVHANIAYIPKSTPCIHGLLPETQILQSLYHEYIDQDLHEAKHNTVLLVIQHAQSNNRLNIHRSIYDTIREKLNRLVANSNLQVEVFDDNDEVSFIDMLKMFYRAKLIIGIHGDGLANMIYARPGTYVVEMLCQPPETSLRYPAQAGVLGHHYHAVPINGCPLNVSVNVEQLTGVAAMYIDILKAADTGAVK